MNPGSVRDCGGQQLRGFVLGEKADAAATRQVLVDEEHMDRRCRWRIDGRLWCQDVDHGSRRR